MSTLHLYRCIVLKTWGFDFLQIWLEMPIHIPKIFVFGGLNHKRDWSSSRPPKGISLARTVLTWCFWWRSVKQCDLGMSRRNQKKNARKETYSGKLGVRPDHPRWCSDMWSWMPGGHQEIVLSFRFCQNRLNGYVGGRISPFPIPKASGLYNSLYYRTSRDINDIDDSVACQILILRS